MTVVLRPCSVVLSYCRVGYKQITCFIGSHTWNSSKVDKIRSDFIFKIKNPTFIDVISVCNGQRAIDAITLIPVLETICAREEAEVIVNGICVHVIHSTENNMYQTVLVYMHIPSPI